MNFAYWNVFSAEIMIYLLQIYEIRHLLVFKNEKNSLNLYFECSSWKENQQRVASEIKNEVNRSFWTQLEKF